MKTKLTHITFITLLATSISVQAGLGNGYGITIDVNEHSQSETWTLHAPGVGVWVENGKMNFSKKMPACIVILGEALDADKLALFINNLEGIKQGTTKLPIEIYRGTYAFVDKAPANSPFGDTDYVVSAKNNMTFGHLLQYVGGTQESIVSIYFNLGCSDLDTRAFLPEKNATVSLKLNRKQL